MDFVNHYDKTTESSRLVREPSPQLSRLQITLRANKKALLLCEVVICETTTSEEEAAINCTFFWVGFVFVGHVTYLFEIKRKE